MERRYCSRCLQTFVAPGPDVCPRSSCRSSRPLAGWPGFFRYGDMIGERYRIEEILGAGGAGVTYRCVDMLNGEETALKVLHSDRKRGTLANRLLIEGECLELLEHPHIVPFRALRIVGDGPYYLATLHMEGGSLDRYVRRHGPLSPSGTIELGRQLAMGLDFVHAGGIVHRDLKPANVLLEVADVDAPAACLADFGIARLYRNPRPLLGGLTRTGAFIGTPEYAAPEQIRGEQGIGPAADAFAFGALLHFAASGEPLLKRDNIGDWATFRDRKWEPADRPRLADLVDSDDIANIALLDDVIDRLMHPTPRQRIDLATAALRFGADPAALARADAPQFAPPSLTGGGTEEEQIEAGMDPEALVPGAQTGMDTTRPRIPVQLSPIHDRTDDVEEIEVEWPTREQRRNRRHALALVAAALLVGTAFAWPGGPAGLIGPERAAALGSVAELLSSDVTAYTTVDPRETARDDAVVADDQPAARLQTAGVSLPRPVAERRTASPPQRRAPEPVADVQVEPAAAAPPAAPPVEAAVTVAASEPTGAPSADAAPASADTPPIDPALANSAVAGWASDPEDDRTLSEVLKDEEALSRERWRDDLVRSALEADERAATYQLDARLQDARRARLQAEWYEAQRQSRTARDADMTDNAYDEEPPPRPPAAELPTLDEIFDRPRVDPVAQSCD